MTEHEETTMDSPESPTPKAGPKAPVHRGIVTAGAVVAMVLGGLGIAAAQTSGTDAGSPATASATAADAPAFPPRDGHGPGLDLAVAAKAIGVSAADLRTALQSGQSIADVAKAHNVDVQKVIDALVADATSKLPARVTEAVNRAGGPGHEGPGGPGRHGPHGPRPDLAVAAQAIGVSAADLRTALQSGQSIADVAKAHNVDVQKVIDALVADAKAHLAADVQAGRLTQAQADRLSANLAPRITDMVNHVRPAGPPPADGMAPAPADA